MKLAVYGILADGVGSGAGAFPKLLRALLERGHDVDFFGMRGFNHPESLERFENYRFLQIHVPFLERVTRAAAEIRNPYPIALVSQIAHFGYQRETLRRIEAEHPTAHYDLVVCTDAQALCRSALPVLSWPQSPPQTEASALRNTDVARAAVQNQGVVRYTATQGFYAYRWVLARAALGATDLFVCGSHWARTEWQNFGADPEALRTLAYPIELDDFVGTPSLGDGRNSVTFLWLGRAVPRKRLDLFLDGFALLHRRRPEARARLVGNLANDPFAARLLDRYREHPAVSVEGARRHDGVAALFSEVDVVVQPSQHENFGFSVAEALAAGRAVIVGPTNGTADYAGKAGFIFSDYRPEAVAETMDRAFVEVRENGPSLSARARETARANFDVARIAASFTALCREAVTLRSRRTLFGRDRKARRTSE